MSHAKSTPPFAFFLLVLPMGISAGFVGVTLPFVLTRAGFSVSAAAAIVAIGLSANIWRFAWGPVADVTLSLRKWYWIGLTTCAGTLLLLSLIPIRQDRAALLTAMVFVSQVAGTLVVLPVGGLMAHTVPDEKKGRASGWYQTGNLGGSGLGGGAGVWMASHFSSQMAGSALAVLMMVCAAALYFVPDVQHVSGARIGERMREMGHDFRALLASPIVLLTIAMVSCPIGAAGASNLWSAIAPDWRASPDTVALVTGLLSSVASALGCLIGGYTADRVGRWWTYFVSGTVMAVVAFAMAVAPRTPNQYGIWVVGYAVSLGMANASFSALVLNAIGRGAASTKYAIMSSLGNIPCVYMTAFDGWAYDRWHAAGMLNAEAGITVVFIVAGLAALWRVSARPGHWRPRLAGASVVLGLCILSSHPAKAQDAQADQGARLCGDQNPDISIAGCNAIIQRGREKGKPLAAAFASRAIAYMALQDFDRAIQDFTQAIKIDPSNAKVFANRGAVYGARQEWDSAILDFSKVVTLAPTPFAYSDRASMYVLNGQLDAAIQDYTDAIKLDPTFVDAVLNRGLAYASTSRCAQAIPDFTRAIELNAKEPRAFLERGVCYESSKRDDLALADFTAHLALDDRSFAGWERRAVVQARAGRYDRALEDYARALAITPNSPRALFGRGVVKRLTGDTRGGDADIATATALRPAIASEMAARGLQP